MIQKQNQRLLAVICMFSWITLINTEVTNVARNGTSRQFSALVFSGFTWTSDLAVDGCVLNNDPDTQRCCSATQGTVDNFWRLELATVYSVRYIIVYGRDDGGNGIQTSGFRLAIEDASGTEESVYSNQGVTYGAGVFNVSLDHRLVSSVIITRPTANILTLCEVEVYWECQDYSYSPNCSLTCGHCKSDEVCDKLTGACPSGCQPGWQGNRCDEAVPTTTSSLMTSAISSILTSKASTASPLSSTDHSFTAASSTGTGTTYSSPYNDGAIIAVDIYITLMAMLLGARTFI